MTSGILLALALVTITFVGFVWRKASQRYPHRGIHPSDLERFLKVLLSRGLDGGTMVVDLAPVAGQKRFIQFERYPGRGKAGIRFGFPKAPWAQNYYGVLTEWLREHSIEHYTRATGVESVPEFTFVDFGQDTEAAKRFTERVLYDVMGLTATDVVEVSFGNVD